MWNKIRKSIDGVGRTQSKDSATKHKTSVGSLESGASSLFDRQRSDGSEEESRSSKDAAPRKASKEHHRKKRHSNDKGNSDKIKGGDECRTRKRSKASLLQTLGKHPEIGKVTELLGKNTHAKTPLQFGDYLRHEMRLLEHALQSEYNTLWETMGSPDQAQRVLQSGKQQEDFLQMRAKRQHRRGSSDHADAHAQLDVDRAGHSTDTDFLKHACRTSSVEDSCNGFRLNRDCIASERAQAEPPFTQVVPVDTVEEAEDEVVEEVLKPSPPAEIIPMPPANGLSNTKVTAVVSFGADMPGSIRSAQEDAPDVATIEDARRTRKSLAVDVDMMQFDLPTRISSARSSPRASLAGSVQLSPSRNTSQLMEDELLKRPSGLADDYFSLWATWERASLHISKRYDINSKSDSTKNSGRATNSSGRESGADGDDAVDDSDSDSENEGLKDGISRQHTWILHPLAPVRICWDVLTACFVAYECIIGPLSLIDLPENAFLSGMKWILRVFWSIDLPLNFFTGYQGAHGHTEMRHRCIIKRYLERWFIVDFCLLAADYGDPLLDAIDGASISRPIVKAVRVLRTLRLLRFLKLAVIQRRYTSMAMVTLQSHLKSELFQICMSLVKIVVLLLWINHMIACVWFALGQSSQTTTWMDTLKDYGTDESISYGYITAYHWSLSNFHGAMEIHPVSQSERVFGVVAMFCAFLLAAWVVSSITSAMTRLALVRSQKSDKVLCLKQFLIDNNVSSRTIWRIQRNVERHLDTEEQLRTENDIELLAIVSHSLRTDLSFEIFMPTLASHPFLREYQKAFALVMKEVCHGAVQRREVVRGEYLFYENEMSPVPQMYFLKSGKLRYSQEGDEELSGFEVAAGSWFCEQILWTPWSHCGTMRVCTRSASLLTLDSGKFVQIASRSHHHKAPCYAFGRMYVSELNDIPDEELTDLPVPAIDLEDLVYQALGNNSSSTSLQKAYSMVSALTKALDE